MSEITHRAVERYSLLSEKTAWSVVEVSLAWATKYVSQGGRLGLFVDGWTQPWECSVDEEGRLHARCPTVSPFVNPVVVESDGGTREFGESMARAINAHFDSSKKAAP